MDIIIGGDKVAPRPWRPEDADGLLALWTDGRVMRYVGFPNGTTVTREQVERGIARSYPVPGLSRGYYRLAVTSRETGEFMGEAAIGRVGPDGSTYPDIKLLPAFWGRGYGTEALGLVVDFTFTFTAATRAVLEPHVDNAAARKVYGRLGFRQVGEVKRVDPPGDPKGTAPVVCHEFVLTREEWLARLTA